MAEIAPKEYTTKVLPCNGCTTCCRVAGPIVLHPELGDDFLNYDHRYKMPNGQSAMLRKADGACWYLGSKGCSIYDRRPVLCRVFDCTELLHKSPGLSREMRQAAEACERRMVAQILERHPGVASPDAPISAAACPRTSANESPGVSGPPPTNESGSGGLK